MKLPYVSLMMLLVCHVSSPSVSASQLRDARIDCSIMARLSG
jgi:hypothetical protein